MEGLKFKVSSQELKSHLVDRAAHHRDKASEKEAIPDDIKKTIEASHGNRSIANMVPTLAKSAYHANVSDSSGSLQRDIEDHQAKAAAFEFFASHLFDEDYTLREEELIRLELVRRI